MSSRDFITVKVEDDDDEPVIIESSSLGGSQTGLKMQTMLERDSQATEEHHYLSQISYEGEDLSSSIQTDNSTDEMDYGLPHKRRRVPSMLENNTEDPFEGTSSSSQNLELGDSRRNPHFIEEENEILARMVRENYARLFGNLAARTSAVEKHEIWQRISKAVSSLGVHHRTIDKCKKRYHDLKGKVKSKLRKIEAHRRDTGTTLSVSMAPSEKIIQDLIPRAMVQRVHPMSDSQQVDTQCNSVLQWIEDEAGELEHSPEENTESYCHEINDFPQSPDPLLLGSGEPESEQKEVFIALEPLQTPLREDSEVFDDHQNQTQDHPALLNHLLREMKQYRRAQTRHNTAVLSNLRTIAQEMRTISSSFQTLNSTLQSLVTLASFIYAAPPQMDTPPRQSETSPLHSAAASPTNSSLAHMRIVSPQGSSTADSRSSGKYHEESPQVTRWSERFRKKKT